MNNSLYQASPRGNINTLYTQIKRDPYVLERIDTPPFGTTPLHIAAQSGQTEFAAAVLYLMPSFASKLDQSLSTPMHLALENNKIKMVLWLLRLDNDLVRIKGANGTTPFMYAVIQGNIEILTACLDVCPDCITDINIRGENALHIALVNNRIEAFKYLLGWLRRSIHPNSDAWEKELSEGKNKEGNTVLHTAASIRNHEAIQLLAKYYPLQKKVRNLAGMKPQDILPNNAGNAQTRKLLNHDGNTQTAKLLNCFNIPTTTRQPSFNRSNNLIKEVPRLQYIRTRITRERMKIDGNTRNAMLVVTVLVITILFQGFYSPAGGLSPAHSNNMTTSPIHNVACTNNTISPSRNITCDNNIPISNTPTNTDTPPPGTAVMDKYIFRLDWFFNTSTLILAYALTFYLIPPGYGDRLFNLILLGLALSYAVALITMSPVSYLGLITIWVFMGFYTLAVAILSYTHRFSWIVVGTFIIGMLTIGYYNLHG